MSTACAVDCPTTATAAAAVSHAESKDDDDVGLATREPRQPPAQ